MLTLSFHRNLIPVNRSPTLARQSGTLVLASSTFSKTSKRKYLDPGLPNAWEGFPYRLDYGMYWFGKGNSFRKQLVNENEPSRVNFFDPSRKHTVIYTHGWELDRVRQKYRETFDYRVNDPLNSANMEDDLALTADAWIDQGWNVGVFYWDQFGDEISVFDTEAKIWKAPSGNAGMRYKTLSGFSTEGAPKGQSVVDLFVSAVRECFGEYSGSLRIVGHSMGSQVALGTSHRLLKLAKSGKLDSNLIPDRVALMDPYFSLKIPMVNPQSYLPDGNDSVASTCLKYAQELQNSGTVLELIKTSPLARVPGVCDPNEELVRLCASVERFPDWISSLDWQGQHVAAPSLYFQSFKSPPPPLLKSALATSPTCRSPSASSTNDQIRECMRLSRGGKFIQVGGKPTFDVDSDTFELQRR